LGEGIGQLGASFNIDVAGNREFSSFLLAGLISSDIGIVVLAVDVVLDDVIEGGVHPSSVATLVSKFTGAVN